MKITSIILNDLNGVNNISHRRTIKVSFVNEETKETFYITFGNQNGGMFINLPKNLTKHLFVNKNTDEFNLYNIIYNKINKEIFKLYKEHWFWLFNSEYIFESDEFSDDEDMYETLKDIISDYYENDDSWIKSDNDIFDILLNCVDNYNKHKTAYEALKIVNRLEFLVNGSEIKI